MELDDAFRIQNLMLICHGEKARFDAGVRKRVRMDGARRGVGFGVKLLITLMGKDRDFLI